MPKGDKCCRTCYACKACDETLSGEKDSGYRGCQDKTRSGEICVEWCDFYESLHPNRDVGSNHNYCRNPNGGPTIWCFTENGFGQCDPKGFEKAYGFHSMAQVPYLNVPANLSRKSFLHLSLDSSSFIPQSASVAGLLL